MKKVLQLGIFLCFCLIANSQRVYFIYLQSENSAPFYVKMNDKVISSTGAGYVILPQLKDTIHTLYIGAVGSKNIEAKFAITINNNDKGYLVKNTSDELSLFDLQSMAIIKAESRENRTTEATIRKEDAFTKLLAQAAGDSSLLNQPIIAKKETPKKTEEKKPVITEPEKSETETIKKVEEATNTTTLNGNAEQKEVKVEEIKKEEVKAEEKVAVKEEAKIEEEKKVELKEEIKTEETKTVTPVTEDQNNIAAIEDKKEYKRSIVSRRSESSTTEGFGLVFLDNTDGEIDTIKILIPNPKTAIKSEPENKVDDVKFLDMPATEKAVTDNKKEVRVCTNIASDNDFKKLRRNMAAETTDEKMIKEAKDAFKKKCYTTAQIKNLSTLFLTDQTKFQFLEVAYNNVTDKNQYSTLISELSEEKYKNSLKALTAGEQL